MRIAFDGRAIHDRFPGIGRYAYNLALALARTQPDLELAVLHDPRQPNTRYSLAALQAYANVRLTPVDAPTFAPAEQWRVPRALRAVGAQVYHSPYYVMPYRPGVPTVVTVHDLIPLIPAAGYGRRARWLFAVSVRLAVRAAQRVITVSAAAAADLTHILRVPPHQVVTIPEAADPAFAPQPPERVAALRARLGLPERYLLYVGSNKPHKNLERLVRACLRLESAPPLMVAGPWEARYSAVRAIVEQAAAEARVRFLGPVAADDLPALYTGAALFVFPSLYEGFGLPPLEAMACGAPVACSSATSLPEVVGDAALLFDPASETEIAAALRRALEGDALPADLRRRGLAQAARFSWDRAATQTAAIYRALAAESA
ncbi:MAG: glycosyltransferase family 4 protein [Anaerolineales bacterium]|nr:glycosyltransferase family 4 protein [Anaerolineales bacterium]